MPRTTHPAFSPKYAHLAHARPIDWRERAYGFPVLDADIDPEARGVPRFEFTLFAPTPVPPTPSWESLVRRVDFDRLWEWTGDEAQRVFPRPVLVWLRDAFLDDLGRTRLPVWMSPYISEGLCANERTIRGVPLKLWAARTRLGLVVATEADVCFDLIPKLRTREWG